MGPHRSDFYVELEDDPSVDQGAAQDAIRAVLKKYPAFESEVITLSRPPHRRKSERRDGSGSRKDCRRRSRRHRRDRADKNVVALGKIPSMDDFQFKRQSDGCGAPLAVKKTPRRGRPRTRVEGTRGSHAPVEGGFARHARLATRGTAVRGGNPGARATLEIRKRPRS